MPFVLGSVPPVLFLLYSQWAMYGNPFLPGQFWMPHQNEYVGEGMRGFTAPDPGLFLLNLFAPGYGLFVWGPLLLVALIPSRFYSAESLVLPRRERMFVFVLVLAFLVFCSSNQYSRLQWNTGFRYLLPLVPFLFLALADHLARLSAGVLAFLSALVFLHSWVLTMVRHVSDQGDVIIENWRRFLGGGVQLPWLNVLRSTPSLPYDWLHSPALPYGVLAFGGLVIAGIWLCGRRARREAGA